MRLLLDTHIYLWFLADSRKLSRSARSAIATSASVWVSAASIWEATIKIGVGKLRTPSSDVVAGIAASGFGELPVTAAHAAHVATLPAIHRDPFDRILVAQAMLEPLNLLSSDPILRRYTDLVILA